MATVSDSKRREYLDLLSSALFDAGLERESQAVLRCCSFMSVDEVIGQLSAIERRVTQSSAVRVIALGKKVIAGDDSYVEQFTRACLKMSGLV